MPNRPAREESSPALPDGSIKPDWAWAQYEPTNDRPWDLRWAGHLYRRAAFGAGWKELQQAVKEGPQRSIDRLLQPDSDVTAFNETYDSYAASATDSDSTDTLCAWWLRRMIETPHPLLEKMTLFWHHHFGMSNIRVKNAFLMHQHLKLLRRHALGSFEPLLEGVSSDPAVLIALDSTEHRKVRPNEDYAREFLQNFGLGAGEFAESDVRETARAFTGWFVFGTRFRYIEREHDSGAKTILGQEGDFDGKDVVRIVLTQPAASRLVVRKLYRWLISETEEPSADLIAPLAESFAKDYDVAKLVGTMLRSNLFFSPIAYRMRVKNPIEYALGIVRAFEATVSTTELGRDLAALGQNLYTPPTVEGWKGGHHWINSTTMVGRSNLAHALLSGTEPYGDKIDPWAVATNHGASSIEAGRSFLLDLLLQGDVDSRVREALSDTERSAADDPSQQLRQFTHLVVTLPEFQLA